MMKDPQNPVDRRNFLKAVGTAGLAAAIAGKSFADANKPAEADPNQTKEKDPPKGSMLPRRKLGRADIKVPILSNGVMFDVMGNLIILQANLRYGVTYWDTAYGYAGGNSERGVGEFLKKNPELRKNIFLVTKASRAHSVEQVEQKLQESLKRMNTDYVDLYYGVHGCNNPDSQLTEELGKWSRSAKQRGLIKCFGFSTHSNMADCLLGAAKRDWIDAVMTTYNVSEMQNPKMQTAVEECHKAGVGLIAMKVIRGVQRENKEAESKLVAHFLEKGYTRGQALIKAVLSDERIACACVRMENVTTLKSNVAAVLDKTELTHEDIKAFREYSKATCSGYCAGCEEICKNAAPDMPYVRDVMRYLMYYKSYGEADRARELFARLPARARSRLTSADYSLAEARCPQSMPIAELMAEAVHKLA